MIPAWPPSTVGTLVDETCFELALGVLQWNGIRVKTGMVDHERPVVSGCIEVGYSLRFAQTADLVRTGAPWRDLYASARLGAWRRLARYVPAGGTVVRAYILARGQRADHDGAYVEDVCVDWQWPAPGATAAPPASRADTTADEVGNVAETHVPVDFAGLPERIRRAIRDELTAEERAAIRLASRLLQREVAAPASVEEAKALLRELEAAGYTLEVETRPYDVLPNMAVVMLAPPHHFVVAYRRVEAARERVMSGTVLVNGDGSTRM